jgi:SAM-dependent methyltransferase
MHIRDALTMLEGTDLAAPGPTVWADLGCGDGTFTTALAELVAPGSTIHAMDRDARAVSHIPPHHGNAQVETHRGDFTTQPWPFGDLDGILMANSLHYVRNQAAFILDSRSRMRPRHRFLIVEYDTDKPNRWVPYPMSRAALTVLFESAGYSSIAALGTRPSSYQRAGLYAAIVQA